MKSRRWVWNLLRVAITAAALAVVVRTIEFRDHARLTNPSGRVSTIHRSEYRKIALLEGVATVEWADGRTTRQPALHVSEHPGFFTLFDRLDKPLFFAMVASLIVPLVLVGTRWWLLLRAHGFAVPYGRVFLVSYAGAFFGHFLPGSVGGDVAKALLVSEGEERKAAAVGTVVLDRAVGLAAMIFLAAACAAPFAGRFEDRTPIYAIYGLAAAVVAAYVAYFNPPLRRFLRERLPFRDTLIELDGVFRSARERRPLLAAAAALSILSQAATIVIVYGLARAMGISGVPLWAFFVFEPVIFIITALPISLGGWGVQEGAYAYLFGTFAGMDKAEAVALSVLFKLSLILVTVPGGVLFALGAARRR